MPGIPLPTIPQADIAKHNNENSCYITIGTYVYDVTDFLQAHPGGADLILQYAGKDVEKIMKDSDSHEHSESAYDIVQEPQRLVGLMATDKVIKAVTKSSEPHRIVPLLPDARGMQILKENGAAKELEKQDILAHAPAPETGDPNVDFMNSTQPNGRKEFLDLEKPMLKQIWNSGFSKDFYLEQVHRATYYNKGASAPLFGNFLEPLSITPWWVIPLLWYPCDAFLTYKANTGLSSPLETAAYWLLGLGLWTLVEYGMHRGLFHVDKCVVTFDSSCNV